MTTEITEYDDIIDSRDVQSRIEDLEYDLQVAYDACAEDDEDFEEVFEAVTQAYEEYVEAMKDEDVKCGPPLPLLRWVKLQAVDDLSEVQFSAQAFLKNEDAMLFRKLFPTLEDWVAHVKGDTSHPNNDEAIEYLDLKELEDEGSCNGADWKYGATLIRESYFQSYAEELADDIGAIDSNASWPLNCIDWERAARELAMDYSQVEFRGVTYYVRS